MMHSNVLFFPIMFACTSNNDYKKIQKSFASLDESSKVVDVISDVYGFDGIDATICPVMQLYNPIDFHSRDIDLHLEIHCESSYKHMKKLSKFLPLPNTMILYSSSGMWDGKEIQPVFKPLSEIPSVSSMVENGDIPKGEMAILYFMLPIVILHNIRNKLDKIVDSIIYNESVNEESMDRISKELNEHFSLKNGTLMVSQIDDADFLEESFELIEETIGEAMVEGGYILTPIIKDPKIGRNEQCPCGSGKKYKNCCINRLN